MPRRSIRLPAYDYRTAGGYFVTLCTYRRWDGLSRIENGGVILLPAGRIVASAWHRLPGPPHWPCLDAFVVMPDHVHLVVHLSGAPRLSSAGPGPHVGSLAALVRTVKAVTTRRVAAHLGRHIPLWQRNYYEHVVRSAEDLNRIRHYIVENPVRWAGRGVPVP